MVALALGVVAVALYFGLAFSAAGSHALRTWRARGAPADPRHALLGVAVVIAGAAVHPRAMGVAVLAVTGVLVALAVRPPAAATLLRAIYGVIFVSGVARSFLQPARQALSSEIVPRDVLANAVTWRSTVWQASAVGGPALGGVLYGLAGAPAAFAIDTALMVGAFLAFTRVRSAAGAAARAAAEQLPAVQSLVEGLQYIRGQPVLLGAMTLDLFSLPELSESLTSTEPVRLAKPRNMLVRDGGGCWLDELKVLKLQLQLEPHP